MKERLKTLLLCSLMLSSLGLSAYLWLGLPGPRLPVGAAYLPPALEPAGPEVRELVVPVRVVLRALEGSVRVGRPGEELHAAVWQGGLVLRQALAAVAEPVPEPAGPPTGPVVELHFPLALSLRDWAELFTSSASPELGDNQVHVFRLYLGEEVQQLSVEGPAGTAVFALRASAATLVERAVEWLARPGLPWEALSAEATGVPLVGEVLAPPVVPGLPLLRVQSEALPDELLRKVFFDTAAVRRITERDGSVIYTDGRRGVRLYPEAGWEYTTPVGGNEEVKRDLDALTAAVKFIARHGGFVPQSRVAGLERVSSGGDFRWYVHFSFDIRGIPVVGQEAPLMVRVGAGGIEACRRVLRRPGEFYGSPSQIITAATAVKAAIAALGASEQRLDAEELQLEAVDLVYWNHASGATQELYTPVWVVQLHPGRLVTVDAVSGRAAVKR